MAALTFKVGGDTTGLGRAVSRAKGMLSGLGSAAKSLSIGGAAVGGLAAGAAAFKGLKVAMEAERSAVAFEAMLGSADKAADMMQYLAKESKRTGVETGVMEQNIKRLIANGMGVDDAKELTRSLLDVSGTLGMTSAEAGLLGSALAQVKAKGVASMEELRQQIAERGVPIFDVLAQKIGVTNGELIKMVSEGKVSADVVMEAFKNLEGPLAKFRGGADKMANTAGGAFSVMKAELVDLLRQAGGPFMSSVTATFKAGAQMIRDSSDWLIQKAKEAGELLGKLFDLFRSGNMGEVFTKSLLIAGKEFVNLIVNAFLGVGRMVGELFKGALNVWLAGFKSIMDPEVWKGLAKVLISIAKDMGLAFVSMVPKALRPFTSDEDIAQGRRIQGMNLRAGAAQIANSAGVQDYLSAWKSIIPSMKEAFVDQIGTSRETLDTQGDRARLREIFGKLSGSIQAVEEGKKEAAEVAAKAAAVAVSEVGKVAQGGARESVMRPILTSLGRLGGDGLRGGRTEIQMNRERNNLLKRIEVNTAEGSLARYA